MTLSLGQNPWVLIGLSFLELLFIIIPATIAAKIEHTSLKVQIKEMGFQIPKADPLHTILKSFAGAGFGVLLFLGGNSIYYFYQFIIEAIFGAPFFEEGSSGAISTLLTNPDLVQFIIFLVLQFAVIAIAEEAFFRAFLIKKLEKRFQILLCILISSALFALYHVPPFLVPITTIISLFGFYFTFGVILSLIFIGLDRSFIAVVFCHGIYNIMLLLV